MTAWPRLVCRFSCGAASAIATKLILSEFPADRVFIVNAFVEEEHPDNRRFLQDCERWFQHPITVFRDTKYGASAREVWRRKQFMKSAAGAPCSKALKADLLDAWREPGDVTVLGYTAGEEGRLERFFDRMSDHLPFAPLIELGVTKDLCFELVREAGIELPAMYRLGYKNANCIGCVKGGMGYWNKIRRDFPERYAEISAIQESIGPGAYLFQRKKGEPRISLAALPPDAGRYQDEPSPSCGFSCEAPSDWANINFVPGPKTRQ